MPRYYFDLVSLSLVTKDEDGIVLADQLAAIVEGRKVAKSLGQQFGGNDGALIRIRDQDRQVLCDVLINSFTLRWRA